MGYLYGGMALAYVFGPSVLNVIGDWRLTFILFLLPLTLVSLVLAIIGVPSTASSNPSSQRYIQGFKAVFKNPSAIACVIANMLFGMAVRVLHNRVGRKQLTVLCTFITGVLTVAYINIPSLWLSLVFLIIATLTTSVKNASYGSLTLEQVPEYRGTMMSLSQFSENIAGALGTGLGGLILITFDYGQMGVLGISAIIASVIFHFFTRDPTQHATQ
jgi:predicted MFS family arabinose efflux permease